MTPQIALRGNSLYRDGEAVAEITWNAATRDYGYWIIGERDPVIPFTSFHSAMAAARDALAAVERAA